MHSIKSVAAERASKLTAILLASAAMIASPVAAQTSSVADDQASAEGLGTIIVTATKRSENLQDVPVSISAISSEQLLSRGVTATNDLGSVVPNLQVSSQYGETSPNFSMRGVGVANEFNANTASPIGVYVDEVSQTFRYTHGAQLFDLDRVEVLRGPQGTLFGRNTTGGAVNIYTRKPKLEGNNGYLMAGYGNFDRWRMQGAAEVTLVPDEVGLRVAFNRAKGDGYFKEVDTANGAQKSYGSSDNMAVRANLRVRPNENLDINIQGFYSKDDPIGYPEHYIGLIGGAGGKDFFGNTRDGGTTPGGAACCDFKEVSLDKGGKFITKVGGAALNVNYTLSDAVSFTSVTGYNESRYSLDIDNDGTPSDVYFIKYRSEAKDFSQDFRVNYNSDRFKGLLGVYYAADSITSDNLVLAYNILPDAAPGTLPQNWLPGIANSFNVNFGYNQKRKTFAAYSEGTYDATDKLSLTLGLRYTKDKVDFLNAFSTPVTDDDGVDLFDIYSDYNLNNKYSNWSGRAIANYAWTDDVKTYASFSRGYRSATYNGFGFVSQAAVYYVVPERLDSYELGFKTRFADDRLQLNGALFHYEYKKQQVTEVVAGVSFLRSLDAKVDGAELELLAKPVPPLTLRGAIGYLDAKYNDGQAISGVDVSGNRVPFASKWTLSFGGDLTLGQVAEGKVVLSSEVAYKSSYWFDAFGNNQRPAAVVIGNGGGVVQLYPGGKTDLVGTGGYALVNSSLAWNRDNLQLRLWAKNLLDKEYYAFGYDTASSFGTVLQTPGVPRTFGVEATIRF